MRLVTSFPRREIDRQVLLEPICRLHYRRSYPLDQPKDPPPNMSLLSSQRDTVWRLRRSPATMELVAQTSRCLLHRSQLDENSSSHRPWESTLSRQSWRSACWVDKGQYNAANNYRYVCTSSKSPFVTSRLRTDRL